jgi:hypothetical protein
VSCGRRVPSPASHLSAPAYPHDRAPERAQSRRARLGHNSSAAGDAAGAASNIFRAVSTSAKKAVRVARHP